MPAELVEVEGHIIDSLILAKVLDVILDAGADYRLVDVEIGRTNIDPSRARLEVSAADDDALAACSPSCRCTAPTGSSSADAELVPCTVDGVLPAGFYSTTNLPTQVRVDGQWLDVENPEMDCALVVLRRSHSCARCPMHRVRMGDHVVVGNDGVRVQPLERPRGPSPFEFMASEVSSEKPKELLVAQVAERIRARTRRRRARCWPCAGRRSSTPAPGPTSPGSCARAWSTCSSRATASPPTTSSPTCWARRSA